jgi:hypothetical protein
MCPSERSQQRPVRGPNADQMLGPAIAVLTVLPQRKMKIGQQSQTKQSAVGSRIELRSVHIVSSRLILSSMGPY